MAGAASKHPDSEERFTGLLSLIHTGRVFGYHDHAKSGRCVMADANNHNHGNEIIEKLDIRIEYCVP